MEYVYAAMLLHKAGHKIDEEGVKKVMTAAGIKPEEARIKALVAALDGVNIDEAIKTAAVCAAPAAQQSSKHESKPEEKKESKPKEDSKSQEQAAAGLGALFG